MRDDAFFVFRGMPFKAGYGCVSACILLHISYMLRIIYVPHTLLERKAQFYTSSTSSL